MPAAMTLGKKKGNKNSFGLDFCQRYFFMSISRAVFPNQCLVIFLGIIVGDPSVFTSPTVYMLRSFHFSLLI
jgi:hypothetical protein